jgi:alkanesulfonate monooxygenase SsuD/methylene tetrahydromethanopterin reductase-like flavin-dependent oxidoreductase (luciferase family)
MVAYGSNAGSPNAFLSIIGSKETVQKKLNDFLEVYQIDELMAVTNVYDHKARLRSYEILKEAITG